MSDEKTVFIQPGHRPAAIADDQTVIAPRPGGRPVAAQPVSTHAAPSHALSNPADVTIQNGLNPLVTAASVILTVCNRLRTTLEHNDVQGLQQQLIEELKQFEHTVKNQQISQEQIVSARYLLCTMLDEVVLNTPWGAASRWSEHSLLSKFHNETSGGEKCFIVLQRMLEAPAQHLEALELFYLSLNLGFEGKYKLDPRGRESLDHISNTLYQTIKNYRGEFEPDLSPNWSSQATQKQSMLQYIPVWVVLSCVLLLLTLTFSGFRLWLYQATEPAAERLQNLTQIVQGQPEQK